MVLGFLVLCRDNSIENTTIREEHVVFQQIVGYRKKINEKVNRPTPLIFVT